MMAMMALVHYPDFRGVLHCLDAKTSEVYWVHDLAAAVWGSPLVADGRVYLGDVDGDVVVLQAGGEFEGRRGDEHGKRRVRLGSPSQWALVISSRNQLFMLANEQS